MWDLGRINNYICCLYLVLLSYYNISVTQILISQVVRGKFLNELKDSLPFPLTEFIPVNLGL